MKGKKGFWQLYTNPKILILALLGDYIGYKITGNIFGVIVGFIGGTYVGLNV